MGMIGGVPVGMQMPGWETMGKSSIKCFPLHLSGQGGMLALPSAQAFFDKI